MFRQRICQVFAHICDKAESPIREAVIEYVEKETKQVLSQSYEETVVLPPMQQREKSEQTIDHLLTGERAWLVRKCALITRNADAAEDLAQETLLEAWRNQYKLHDLTSNGQAQVRKWLAAIAQSICLRWLREDYHERAHRVIQQLPLANDSSASSQGRDQWSIELVASPDKYSVEIELERAELNTLLSRALSSLSEPLRAAMVARYLQGASHDEITQQLQVSEEALVQRIYRGKQALRLLLTTSLSDELATYGIYPQDAVPRILVTRMYCPWCGNDYLVLNENAQNGKLSFRCRSCHTSAGGRSNFAHWQKMSSAAAKYIQLIAWLYAYYWQAIDQQPACFFCGETAILTVKDAESLPPKYHGLGDQQGVAIVCSQCQRTHYNTLSHLTFDLPQVQRFWKTHKRVHWQQGEQIEHAGIPAVVSVFQSKSTNNRIEVLIDRQTFRVLAINEH